MMRKEIKSVAINEYIFSLKFSGMLALDAGAEDFAEEEDSFEVITDPDSFSEVREALEKEGIPMLQAEVTMIPQNWVDVHDDETVKKMNRLLGLLDEDDDVQNVYHNWDE